jgi:bacteriocin biosynthesis cyclodehydratase domain-containing protein
MTTKVITTTDTRPMLNPALRRLWRDPGTLQLGIDPRHAVVLSGLDAADRAVIERLDGSRDLADLLAAEAEHGCRAERVRELVTLLADAGALAVPATGAGRIDPTNPLAPDLLAASLLGGGAGDRFAERAATQIEVYGAGRVGAALAGLLAAAGIGAVIVRDKGPLRHVDLSPAGVRSRDLAASSRGEATQAVVQSVLRSRDVGRAVPAATRSVVVLAPVGAVIPPEWLRQVRHRPHLAVLIRDTAALIGPLVLPRQTPCLRCVELARADRDPAWPALAAQLVSASRGVEACDTPLAAAAAALASMHLLRWLDQPDSGVPILSGILELSLADLQLRRRTVAPHPGCGCGASQQTLEL